MNEPEGWTVWEEGWWLRYFYGLSVVLETLFVFIGRLHWKLPDALRGSACVRLDYMTFKDLFQPKPSKILWSLKISLWICHGLRWHWPSLLTAWSSALQRFLVHHLQRRSKLMLLEGCRAVTETCLWYGACGSCLHCLCGLGLAHGVVG